MGHKGRARAFCNAKRETATAAAAAARRAPASRSGRLGLGLRFTAVAQAYLGTGLPSSGAALPKSFFKIWRGE